MIEVKFEILYAIANFGASNLNDNLNKMGSYHLASKTIYNQNLNILLKDKFIAKGKLTSKGISQYIAWKNGVFKERYMNLCVYLGICIESDVMKQFA